LDARAAHVTATRDPQQRSVPSNIRAKAIAKILLERFCSILSAVTNTHP
jgi:hypothetical protein